MALGCLEHGLWRIREPKERGVEKSRGVSLAGALDSWATSAAALGQRRGRWEQAESNFQVVRQEPHSDLGNHYVPCSTIHTMGIFQPSNQGSSKNRSFSGR